MSLEALSRGDIVISTSRSEPPPRSSPSSSPESTKVEPNLRTLGDAGADIRQLDTTSSFPTLVQFAKEVIEKYGRVDVLVNNTGYPAVGSLEELGYECVILRSSLYDADRLT